MNARHVFADSACVASVAFSSETNALQVEFRNGLAYEYSDVPADVHQVLKNKRFNPQIGRGGRGGRLPQQLASPLGPPEA